jgi:hypothetical protein
MKSQLVLSRRWMFFFLLLASLSLFPHCQCPDAPSLPDTRENSRDGAVLKDRVDAGQDDSSEKTPEPVQETKPEPRPESTVENKPEPVPEKSEPLVDKAPDKTPDSTNPDKPPSSIIGAPCKTDADCGGTPYHCIKEGELPRFPFPWDSGKGPPGGYCTKSCFANDKECPEDAACYVPGAAAGACMKRCQSASECRSSYTCSKAMTNVKVCMPPGCALKEPKGNYTVLITYGKAVSGGGSCKPLKAGTKLFATLQMQSGTLQWEFGSKPGSPLPVTWRLEGPWKLNDKHKASALNKDGSIEGRFNNGCLMYGTMQVQLGKCSYSYEVTVHKR